MNKQAYEHIVGLALGKHANNGYVPSNIPDMGTAWKGAMGGYRSPATSRRSRGLGPGGQQNRIRPAAFNQQPTMATSWIDKLKERNARIQSGVV